MFQISSVLNIFDCVSHRAYTQVTQLQVKPRVGKFNLQAFLEIVRK